MKVDIQSHGLITQRRRPRRSPPCDQRERYALTRLRRGIQESPEYDCRIIPNHTSAEEIATQESSNQKMKPRLLTVF
ncbi:hypothetical protein PIIN_09947 [Serendipita indica DSM 11827]|uniref:Uncharacterized protein n=1 Tax=Serendipita indica (strain DSM 11827) TaxID=1109443 RepID=G4TXA8_SERID|nr:hypothetical protein PIIN_09947 [Serendipita indica DSM 11827]